MQLFDYFEESRALSQAEFQVRGLAQERLQGELKAKAAYWRQRNKQKIIKECDANTTYHHAHATLQMRRKFIRMVRVNDQELSVMQGKLRPFRPSSSRSSGSWANDFDGS
jgi:hypothetical protein